MRPGPTIDPLVNEKERSLKVTAWSVDVDLADRTWVEPEALTASGSGNAGAVAIREPHRVHPEGHSSL